MILDINTIQQMLVNNLEVKIKQVEIDQQRSVAQNFYSSFMPRLYLFQGVQAERGEEKKTFSGSGVGLNVNLYDGGKDYYASKISGARAEKNRIDKQIRLQELTVKAQDVYLDLLKIDELQKIYSDYENLNAQNVSLVTRKVKSGLLHENELLGFNLISLDVEDDLQSLSRERQKNIIDLSNILGQELNEVQTSPIDFDKVDLKNYFPEKTYDLTMKSFFGTVEELEWKQKNTGLLSGIHANFYSELSFTKNNLGEYLPEANDASKVFGIRVTWDLLDEKNERNLEAQKNLFEIEKSSLDQLKWRTEYANAKKKENIDLSLVEEKLKLLSSRLELNQKILSSSINGFKNGLKDASDLRESLSELIHTKKEIVNYKIKKLKILNEQNI